MKTATITQTDVNKATKESRGKRLACSCVVFQVAKRLGLKPVEAGFNDVATASGIYETSGHGQCVTLAEVNQWPEYVGRKLTFTKQ